MMGIFKVIDGVSFTFVSVSLGSTLDYIDYSFWTVLKDGKPYQPGSMINGSMASDPKSRTINITSSE